jgi:nickel/cobalt transporter (NicO) family protein
VRKLVGGAIGLLSLFIPQVAAAHPMGNFSINVHLGIDFRETSLAATLIIDMAEIPTFQEKELIDSSVDGDISQSEGSSYAEETCGHHRDQIDMSRDGVRLDLHSDGASFELLPGAAGLEILRLTCTYQVDLSNDSGARLEVVNRVHIDRIGWREMTATATGFTIETDLPVISPSLELTKFPQGPQEDRSNAVIDYSRASSSVVAAPPLTIVERLGSKLQVGSLALLTAAGLGIAHALAPGHGKTLMAAFLVGRRGRVRHAAGLGLSVAISHTLGVGILGIVTVLTTSRFEPERIYPWLSIASALVVTIIGTVMLYRALVLRSGHHSHRHQEPDGHPHTHPHDEGREHRHEHHQGHEHTHDHDHGHSHHGKESDHIVGWKSLAALGLAGGLVPSASAVVLLLGAVSAGDPWFGLGLVVAFGIGMAIALVAAGIGAIWAVRLGWRFFTNDTRRHRLERIIPALAGGAVTVVGLILLTQAARVWA